MTVSVQELDAHLNTGFTRSPNEMDDLFLRELPREYYCFWRYIWRKTAGWASRNPKLDHGRTLRDIGIDIGLHVNHVGRAACFFDVCQLIKYTPGKNKTHTASHFELLPAGILELYFLSKAIKVLRTVLALERKMKRHNRNFRYTKSQFCGALAHTWKELGGQVTVAGVFQIENQKQEATNATEQSRESVRERSERLDLEQAQARAAMTLGKLRNFPPGVVEPGSAEDYLTAPY